MRIVRRRWCQSLRRGGGRSGSWILVEDGGYWRLPHGGDFIVSVRVRPGAGGKTEFVCLLARNGARLTARQMKISSEKEQNSSVRRQPVCWLGLFIPMFNR